MQLSDDILREMDEIVARYPNAHSAILPVMHVLQRLEGYITREAQDWVAVRLDMAPSKVEEVLSFYTMLYRTDRKEPEAQRTEKQRVAYFSGCAGMAVRGLIPVSPARFFKPLENFPAVFISFGGFY